MMRCPKCSADISESYEPDDWSIGIVGGWYCDACDTGFNESEIPHETFDDDVPIFGGRDPILPLGMPVSDLAGRPDGTRDGQVRYENFERIAKSWGYD